MSPRREVSDVDVAALRAAQQQYELAKTHRRRAITTARLLGLSWREIADAMGLSVGTVHTLANPRTGTQ